MAKTDRILKTFLAALAFAAAAMASYRYLSPENLFPLGVSDLDLRINEIKCSSTRVNPFDVWSGKVVHENFCGYPRPDLPSPPAGGDSRKRRVHAYPPWHTALFWFYNFLPDYTVRYLMAFCYGAAFMGIVAYVAACFKRHLAPGGGNLPFAWGAFALLQVPVVFLSIGNLNYPVLIAGIMALMMLALEKNHNVLAGVCWALAMVKPQIALLFFWPLLFSRRYVAILVAAGICIAATLFPAWLYGQSPVELVLQIPEIGRPYLAEFATLPHRIAMAVFGSEAGSAVLSCAVFVFCGALSWLFRRQKEWCFRFAPAALCMPVFTYMLHYDVICMWPLGVFLILAALGNGEAPECSLRRRRVLFFALAAIVAVLFAHSAWMIANRHGWPVRGGGAFYAVFWMLVCVMFATASQGVFLAVRRRAVDSAL